MPQSSDNDVQADLHCRNASAWPSGCLVFMSPNAEPLTALRLELRRVSIAIHAAYMLHPPVHASPVLPGQNHDLTLDITS